MSRRLRRSAAIVVLGVMVPFSTACYRHTINVGTGAPSARLQYDHWENFWIVGLIGHARPDIAAMCPTGNATIEARQTFLNGLVSALTSGIYTPTTLRIRCDNGRQAAVALGSDDVRRIVEDEAFRSH
jgi:hypothetical protein